MATTTKFANIEVNRNDPKRKLGFGRAAPTTWKKGMGADHPDVRKFISGLKKDMANPLYNMPTIESVRIHYDGPLTPQAIQGSFGAKINPFGASADSPPPGASSVDSTMVEPGKLQTWGLVCAVGFQVEPEPLCFTAKGNSFQESVTSVAKPVSPDFYTMNDMNNFSAGFNALGLTAGQVFNPAVLEWGWWANLAMFHMVRAYNLRWQVGQHTNIMDDSLRYTAYLPTSGQDGAASNSEVDVNFFARQVNDYYETMATNQRFLQIDRTRVGSFTFGGGEGPNASVFRPTRAYETVGATYGGMGLHSLLKGNSEFRKLTVPYLLRPGVPIGLYAQVSNTDDQALMQRYLDITQGFGGTVPPSFTDDTNILSGNQAAGTATGSIVGTAGLTGAELTLDTVPASISQQVPTARTLYKGGRFKITMAIKGYELTEDQIDMFDDPGIRAAVQSDCGCRVASA
jgi:hypothetical protein